MYGRKGPSIAMAVQTFERNCLVKDHGPPKAALRVLDKTISFASTVAIAIDGFS
jgi:hypothetical protein